MYDLYQRMADRLKDRRLQRMRRMTAEEKRERITRNVMKAGEAHRKRTFGVRKEEK